MKSRQFLTIFIGLFLLFGTSAFSMKKEKFEDQVVNNLDEESFNTELKLFKKNIKSFTNLKEKCEQEEGAACLWNTLLSHSKTGVRVFFGTLGFISVLSEAYCPCSSAASVLMKMGSLCGTYLCVNHLISDHHDTSKKILLLMKKNNALLMDIVGITTLCGEEKTFDKSKLDIAITYYSTNKILKSTLNKIIKEIAKNSVTISSGSAFFLLLKALNSDEVSNSMQKENWEKPETKFSFENILVDNAVKHWMSEKKN